MEFRQKSRERLVLLLCRGCTFGLEYFSSDGAPPAGVLYTVADMFVLQVSDAKRNNNRFRSDVYIYYVTYLAHEIVCRSYSSVWYTFFIKVRISLGERLKGFFCLSRLKERASGNYAAIPAVARVENPVEVA